jgi:hypothetical protein
LGRTEERVLAEPRPICSCSGPHTRAIRVGGLVRRLPFVCPPPHRYTSSSTSALVYVPS